MGKPLSTKLHVIENKTTSYSKSSKSDTYCNKSINESTVIECAIGQ